MVSCETQFLYIPSTQFFLEGYNSNEIKLKLNWCGKNIWIKTMKKIINECNKNWSKDKEYIKIEFIKICW